MRPKVNFISANTVINPLAYLEDIMKKIAIAAAIVAVTATTGFAGGFDAPVMEMAPMVEVTEGSSAGGWVVPLILLALVAAAVAAN